MDEAKEAELEKKFVPKNTATSTKCVVTNFVAWRDGRNAQFCSEPEKQVPMDLFESTDTAVLSKWLSLYVAETRKQDGSPKSIYMLLTGLFLSYVQPQPALSQLLGYSKSPLFILS